MSRIRRSPTAAGYPFPPLLFVIAAGALVLNTIFAQPLRAVVGLDW